MGSQLKLKPLGLIKSIFYFGVASFIVSIGINYFYILFIKGGNSSFWGYILFYLIPLSLMFFGSIVYFFIEGNAITWASFKERFMLNKMKGMDWLWVLIILVIYLLCLLLLTPVTKWIATNIPFLSPGDLTPSYYNPLVIQKQTIPVEFFDLNMKGQWLIFILLIILTNITSSGIELWMRGVIFPRQELVFKNWTWLLNGLLSTFLWAGIWKWYIILFLPFWLILSYIIYKRHNLWITIFVQLIINVNMVVILFFSTIGFYY